ncbi:MAG: hypothetical protein EBU09_01200 [Betaproteobacteria bacterium]|nr:hypothetical protein [Betaproteobacteria bacterium]
MSDAQSEEHGAFIKTPGQLITVVVLAFVVPIFIIVLLSGYVGIGTKTGAGTDPRDPQLIEARVAPVAKLEIKNLANKVAASGETVYKAQCAGGGAQADAAKADMQANAPSPAKANVDAKK